MNRRLFAFACLLLIFFWASCGRGPRLDGYLWYGQANKIACFDLASRKTRAPEILNRCHEASADPLGEAFSFVCANDQGSELRTFSILEGAVRPAGVLSGEQVADPSLSPDAGRTLFRIRRSGDVFDIYLLFKDAGYVKMAGRTGAACFGMNSDTIFLAQGSMVALHMVTDITHPDKMPAGGLRALVTAQGAVRDLHFHLGIKQLAICSGTQVLACDLTGKNLRVLFDAAKAPLPGPLSLPYRARWSFDGTRLAVLLSPDGATGSFLIVDADDKGHTLLKGLSPNVGGFAWTKDRPTAFW